MEPTGDLRGDLQRFLEAYERGLAAPAARAAIPGLLASYQDAVPQPAARWLHLSVRPQFWRSSSPLPTTVDARSTLDEVFDLIQGAVLGRILVPAIAARGSSIDSTVDMVLRILAPSRR